MSVSYSARESVVVTGLMCGTWLTAQTVQTHGTKIQTSTQETSCKRRQIHSIVIGIFADDSKTPTGATSAFSSDSAARDLITVSPPLLQLSQAKKTLLNCCSYAIFFVILTNEWPGSSIQPGH